MSTFDPADRRQTLLRIGAVLLIGPPTLSVLAAAEDDSTYDQDSMLKAATDFFGSTTEGRCSGPARRLVSMPEQTRQRYSP